MIFFRRRQHISNFFQISWQKPDCVSVFFILIQLLRSIFVSLFNFLRGLFYHLIFSYFLHHEIDSIFCMVVALMNRFPYFLSFFALFEGLEILWNKRWCFHSSIFHAFFKWSEFLVVVDVFYWTIDYFLGGIECVGQPSFGVFLEFGVLYSSNSILTCFNCFLNNIFENAKETILFH